MAATAAGCATQWFLLLVAVLGILSGCGSSRDLERFAKRHHQEFCGALDLELPKAPCDSTFLYLFERVELEHLCSLLREWMLAQITDMDEDFDQLICDGKTIRYSQRNGVQVLALLRTLALNLLRCNGFRSIRAGLMAVAHDISRLLGWAGVSSAETV